MPLSQLSSTTAYSLATLDRDHEGNTPLIVAAQMGNAAAVLQHLQEAGCVNRHGMAAIHYAAERGYSAIVEMLVPAEARKVVPAYRFSTATWRNVSALMIAASRGHISVIKLLAPKEGGIQTLSLQTALMRAAIDGQAAAVRELRDLEGTIFDVKGETALMQAARYGRAECVRLLLSKERTLKDLNGWSALVHASYGGHAGSAAILAPYEMEKYGRMALAQTARGTGQLTEEMRQALRA
ncbi:Protein 21.1 [Giardia lamblia P15]|uniref:Protein 21.1 n=1 Tax=Giardia intestinalis (strain P15) TaxID=658858 RepID=E1EZ57_GIAIA|nr:Protein 21.1 [Giardia lamblia P15]